MRQGTWVRTYHPPSIERLERARARLLESRSFVGTPWAQELITQQVREIDARLQVHAQEERRMGVKDA